MLNTYNRISKTSGCFDMPLPMISYRDGLTYTHNLGNLTVWFTGRNDNDLEIESVDFSGTNILPVLEYEESKGTSTLLQEIIDAAAAHLEDLRYDQKRNF